LGQVVEDRPVGGEEGRVGDDRVRGDQPVEGVAGPGEPCGRLHQLGQGSVGDLKADGPPQRGQWGSCRFGYTPDFMEIGQLEFDDWGDARSFCLQARPSPAGQAPLFPLV
jgi:hypothetical protein